MSLHDHDTCLASLTTLLRSFFYISFEGITMKFLFLSLLAVTSSSAQIRRGNEERVLNPSTTDWILATNVCGCPDSNPCFSNPWCGLEVDGECLEGYENKTDASCGSYPASCDPCFGDETPPGDVICQNPHNKVCYAKDPAYGGACFAGTDECVPPSLVDPQCNLPYRSLDGTRNVEDDIEDFSGPDFCDDVGRSNQSEDWRGDGWYRFIEGAGHQMPETPPPRFTCGTHAPGWLNGVHPSVEDGVVSREVCYNWNFGPCTWKNNIDVVNCKTFYLYKLVDTPVCALRYCGESV